MSDNGAPMYHGLSLATGRRRRYVAIFLAALSLMCAGAVVAYRSLPEYTGPRSFDFHALKEREVITHVRLTRRQAASIKLGYIMGPHYRPPRIGVFGNHQIQYFSKNAFGSNPADGTFFNYFYANLALPEIRNYLSFLSAKNLLPSDLVIVQITTPNNDNGDHILRYGGHLTPEINLFPGTDRSAWETAGQILAFANNEIERILNYETLILAGADSGQAEVLQLDRCARPAADAPTTAAGETAPPPALGPLVRMFHRVLDFVPKKFTNVVKDISEQSRCSDVRVNDSFRPDGSAHRVLPADVNLNEYGVESRNAYLRDGDEKKIAALMMEIDRIVKRDGRKVVFLVPPIYESDRPSLVNKIFSKALTLAKSVNVIDHRFLRLDSSYFWAFDHPRERYYRELVLQLSAAHYIPSSIPLAP